MKKVGAAIAALVVGASLFAAVPANASTVSTHSASSPMSTTDALPSIPEAPQFDPAPPPHPLVMPSTEAGAQGAPDESAAAAGTATISGRVTFAGRGPLAGIPVTAYTFPDDGSVGTATSVKSAGDGSFTLSGLPAAVYYVGYDDYSDEKNPSFQWWGAERLNPYGSEIELVDGQSFDASWQLVPTGGVKGVATCSTCTSPPDRNTLVVYVGAWDASAQRYEFVDVGRPAADGSYRFDSLYPAPEYSIFADYTGAGPFTKTSFSPEFSIGTDAVAAQNVTVFRKLTPVDGIYPEVDAAVNALYYDYLTRLPSASDVRFWGSLIQDGANPNIIASGFVTSDEYRYIRIDAAYRTILGREPDAGGRLNWLTGMKGGVLTTDDIETAFYASDEYYLQHGNSTTGFVSAIYQTLLGRPGTTSDYAFWGNLVQTQGRAWVIAQFWDTKETIGQRVSAMYRLYLGRTPDASGLANWVGIALQIGDSGLRAGLSGSDEYFIRSQYRFSERTD